MQVRNVWKASLGLTLLLASSAALAQYKVTNLSSNQVGQARHDDPLIVNAWGLTYAPGSPFWVSDNNSGWSTLYNSSGAAQKLRVEIPTANDRGPGSPTGIVFNGSSEFQVKGWPSIFLFATLDGTISGWAPQSDFNNAIIAVDNSKNGAVYTGLAITSKTSGNRLFAADNANNKVDVYDGNFSLVMSFTDPSVTAGFAVFGIQDINGLVYVTFADSKGGPGGFVDVFTEDGVMQSRAAEGPHLNQPWGVERAPSNFGALSNALLISNNTNTGTIVGFNAKGQFVGVLRDASGNIIHIDQLWAIRFGGGAPADGPRNSLFFTAGPSNNVAGTFGVITLH